MRIKKYVINGSFLTEPIMGVQRYAFEILTRVDKILTTELSFKSQEEGTQEGLSEDIQTVIKKIRNQELILEILVPDENIPENERKSNVFQSIKVVHQGASGGKKWDQLTYAKYLREHRAKGISLCNSVPIFAKTAIVCVHDIVFKTNPDFFTEKGAWHEILYRKLLYWKAFHRADQVITCSEFSKQQIQRCYRLKNLDITVIGNAWQHYNVADLDESIFQETASSKFAGKIKRGEYYFFLSSLAKNKNLRWILENAKKNPNSTYVLCGAFLGDDSGIERLSNVIYVGRVSDAQARALYKYCKAFLFPSLYEGFGIPPMEALCMGAQIIISEIPVLREIYGAAAHYIDPYNADVDLEELMKQPVASAKTVLNHYSWDDSAKKLMGVIGKLVI